MKTIKQKPKIDRIIKTLDKSAITSQRMKNSLVKTKEKTETSQYSDDNSANEYASNTVAEGANFVANNTVNTAERGVNYSIKKIATLKNRHFSKPIYQNETAIYKNSDNLSNAISKYKLDKAKKSKEKARIQANNIEISKSEINKNVTYPTENSSNIQAVNSVENSKNKSTSKSVKNHNKKAPRTIKTRERFVLKSSKKSIKTAEKTGKTSIKTAQNAAKTAKATAQASAKVAKLSMQTAKVAARATIIATRALIKAIITALKELVALIIAGGWIAVAIILIICMVAMIVTSGFGFFAVGENGESSVSLTVEEITFDFNEEVETIKSENTYDILDESQNIIKWKQVLSIYAVITSSYPENLQNISTMNDAQIALLEGVFADMVTLTSYTKEKTTVIDGVTQSDVYLYIVAETKSAEEMALEYGFSDEQMELLNLLLDGKNDGLWEGVV